MKSFRKELTFQTRARREFINITPQVQQALGESGIEEGLLLEEIRICFSVGDILQHYKAACQANPTLKKQTLARFATDKEKD